MQRSEHGSESDVANAPEDNVEGHIDLGVLAAELLWGHVNASTGGDDDADGLINDVDAVKDIDGVVMVGGGDTQNVDTVDEPVHDPITALDADDELAAGGGKWVVADGGDGVSGLVGIGGGGR